MCSIYTAKELSDILFRIRMEVMNGDKHEANRMLLLLQSLINPYDDDDELGECDECGATYDVASRDGRCGDCGNCGNCCEDNINESESE